MSIGRGGGRERGGGSEELRKGTLATSSERCQAHTCTCTCAKGVNR